MELLYISLGVVFIWLIGLTFIVVRTVGHYKKLSERTGSQSIDKVLDVLVDQGVKHSSSISEALLEIKNIHESSKKYYKKIGFVKFNPFERVGGEQSFVIALLNDDNSGIVKTYLYTREGMRVYVKPVHQGASSEYELSEEEKQAIKSASS